MLGKDVKLDFYSNEKDTELTGVTCQITEFDGLWMYVRYRKKKQSITKLIPISSILSIQLLQEGDK